MPSPLEDDPDDVQNWLTTRGRWADLELESGEVVIYDTENPSAWIQSDGAVDLDVSD